MSPELLKPVPIQKVRGFLHAEIQGVLVPNGEVSLSKDDLNKLSVVSVPISFAPDSSLPVLLQTSPDHKRSHDIYLGVEGINWRDQYKNHFSSLSIKGNNLCYPQIVSYLASSSGYGVYGMQDSDSMVRVLRASEILRSNKIDTEMIVGVIEPAELPLNGRLVTAEDFKKSLIKDLFNHIKDARDKETKEEFSIKLEDIARIRLNLEKQIFLFTVRGMQVGERISDLRFCRSKEDLKVILNKAFKFVNQAEKERYRENPEYKPSFFNIEIEGDIERYLTDYLPTRAADNFSKLHNLDLSHGYSHAGNISLVASLYDLDSIMGKLIDPESNHDQFGRINNDVFYFLYGSTTLFDDKTPTNVAEMGVKNIFDELEKNNILKPKNPDEPSRFGKFANTFLRTYIKNRGWEENILDHIAVINSFFLNFDYIINNEVEDSLHYYLKLAWEKLGWEYDEELLNKIALLVIEDTDSEAAENLELILKENPNDQSFDSLITKHIKLHTTKEACLKRGEKIKERIGESFFKNKEQELAKLIEKYGKNTIEALTSISVLGYFDRVNQIVNGPELDRLTFNRLKRRIVKSLGWEDDLITNVNEITNIFEYFLGPGDEEFYNYYLDLIKKQTGFSYTHPDSTEELLEKFHQYDYHELKEIIEEAISTSDPGSDLSSVISQALKTNEKDPFTLFDEFLYEHIGNVIGKECKDQVSELISKYGLEKTLELAGFMIQKTLIQIIKDMTPIKKEELNRNTLERIQSLKESYLNEYSR